MERTINDRRCGCTGHRQLVTVEDEGDVLLRYVSQRKTRTRTKLDAVWNWQRVQMAECGGATALNDVVD